MDKLLYTPEEAATALAIGRSKTYQLLHDGKLRSVRFGRSRRIPAHALHDFVAKLETNGDG